MADPNLSEIATVSIQSRTGKLADNLKYNNAIVYKLDKKGKMIPYTGGQDILEEIEYGSNPNFMYYSGTDRLNTSQASVFSAAEYGVKQAAIAIVISGLEQMQNAGEARQIDLLSARISNAETTAENNMATGMYSDGTGSGSKQIGGLQYLLSTTPTSGTVGTIDRAANTFWRNQTISFATDLSGVASSATMARAMRKMWMKTKRGKNATDLILADNNYYEYYWESLTAIQRINSENGSGMAAAGFEALKFKGADVVLDGGYQGQAPANQMYFLNTDFLRLRTFPGRDWDMLKPDDRVPVDQDAIVKILVWGGNMTASNLFLQGVLSA